MKKLSILLLFLLGSIHANSQTYLVAVGSDIYEVDPLSCTETFLCTISVNTGGGTITSTIEDIAFHPNGNLYGIVSNYFISINLGTCTSTTIATHSTSANSLVAAADGTLYAASDDLYTVDPLTGVFTSVGTLPCQSGGDLAFENGELYLTCASGDLLKVDVNNPANSTIIGNLGTGYWYGLWTVYTDCNNTQILVASENDLYEVDMNTANTTFSCSLGTSWITGATMQGDFNASECGCVVNLGPDQDLCDGPVILNVADSNYTYIWQDGSTDSTFTATTPGNYYVTITDTTDGCTNSDTIVVQGPLAPNAGTPDSINVCLDDPNFDLITVLGGSPDSTGTWSPSPTSGTGVFDPSVDNAGTYSYTVSNSCGTDQADVFVNIVDCELGFSDLDISIKIFPNPSNGIININLSRFIESSLLVSDISGRIVYQQSNSAETMSLDLSELSGGSYFLSVLTIEGEILITKQIQIVK